ncbi:MAG TPA: hypothetical protein VF288_10495 [Mycobacteriales bacterium]
MTVVDPVSPVTPVVLPPQAPSQACLICGQELQVVINGPECAPWQCLNFAVHRNSWWQAELDQRSEYDVRTRSFRHTAAVALRGAVTYEIAAAAARGTSARPDQLARLSAAQLAALADAPGVEAEFAAQARSLIATVP